MTQILLPGGSVNRGISQTSLTLLGNTCASVALAFPQKGCLAQLDTLPAVLVVVLSKEHAVTIKEFNFCVIDVYCVCYTVTFMETTYLETTIKLIIAILAVIKNHSSILGYHPTLLQCSRVVLGTACFVEILVKDLCCEPLKNSRVKPLMSLPSSATYSTEWSKPAEHSTYQRVGRLSM